MARNFSPMPGYGSAPSQEDWYPQVGMYRGDRNALTNAIMAQQQPQVAPPPAPSVPPDIGLADSPAVSAPISTPEVMPSPAPVFSPRQSFTPPPQSFTGRGGGGMPTAAPGADFLNTPDLGGGGPEAVQQRARNLLSTQIPDWFSGGQGDWNRYVNNFVGFSGGRGDRNRFAGNLNVGGQYLFDPTGEGGTFDSGVIGSDVSGVGPDLGGGSPPGGPTPGGPPPTGDIVFSGSSPSIGTGVSVTQDITGQQQDVPGAVTNIGGYNGPGMFGSIPGGQTGLTGLGPTSITGVPGDLPSNLYGNQALSAFNQAGPIDQGAFSTAGMSLADLAEAWGVSIDSAAALADAGFADLSGGGVGGGTTAADDPAGVAAGYYGTDPFGDYGEGGEGGDGDD